MANIKTLIENCVRGDEKAWNELSERLSSLLVTLIRKKMAFLKFRNTEEDIEDIKSEDKLEAAASYIDDAVKLPWYLETIDGPTFKIVLSIVVFYLNKQLGNDWGLDKVRESIRTGSDFIKSIVG